MSNTSLLQHLTVEAKRDDVHQLAVGAVVHHDGKVLLLLRPDDDVMNGTWELPSGNVAPGETLDQAVIREVKQETGLDVAIIRQYLGDFDDRTGGGKKRRQFNFTVDIADPEAIRLARHDAYTWTNLPEELPVTDTIRKILSRHRK